MTSFRLLLLSPFLMRLVTSTASRSRPLNAVVHMEELSYRDQIGQRPRSPEMILDLRGGGSLFAGMHPLGIKLTPLGERFLELHDARESDLGRYLASLKGTLKMGRKTKINIKSEWLEVVRFSKTAEATRIYQSLEELYKFALDAGLIA